MKSDTPYQGNGKTRFTREKKYSQNKGKSWITLRNEAIKAGTFSLPAPPQKK